MRSLKSSFVTAAAAALLVAVAAPRAEAQVPARVILGGGSTLAISDIAETPGFNNGPHGLVGVEVFLPKFKNLGFRVDGYFHRVSSDISNINLQVLNAQANVVLRTNELGAGSVKVSPYFIGGAGFYNTKPVGSAVPPGGSGETDFGFNAGGGLDIQLAKFGIFAEGRFHQIQAGGGVNPRVITATAGAKIGL